MQFDQLRRREFILAALVSSLLLFKLPYPAALLLVLLTATPMPTSASARYSLSRFLIRSLMDMQPRFSYAYEAQRFALRFLRPFRADLSIRKSSHL
jgi:hypothetical protein